MNSCLKVRPKAQVKDIQGDPIWHVSSRSGVAVRLDCKLLYPCTLLLRVAKKPTHASIHQWLSNGVGKVQGPEFQAEIWRNHVTVKTIGYVDITHSEYMGVLCTWVKLSRDLQILGCELHKNAFGSARTHWDTIRYDTRCYFNVRSKADISQLNLPHGTDNWKSVKTEKKTKK